MAKTCVDCGLRLPVDDFYQDKRMADGFRNDCKECMKAKVRARYDRQPDIERARSRDYRNANLEVERARRRARYAERKESR